MFFLVALVAIACCPAYASYDADFDIFPNENNVYSRAVLKANNSEVKYLGDYDSIAECEKVCLHSADFTCDSFAYHAADFEGDWSRGCYGVVDPSWQPTKENKVTSGRKKNLPRCSHDRDCNYNGKCTSGKCACISQWKGDNCDVLNLLPAVKGLGYHGSLGGQNISSWGGSVVVGDDGVYHMYAAEMSGFCGLNVWLSNSIVIHASSPDPTTVPFKKQGVVQGIFSHEPIAARAPTGEYVIWLTAVLPPLLPPVEGGKVCKGCKDGFSVRSCGTDSNRNATTNLPTYMVYSKNPNGPWSAPQMIPGTNVFADSNFAPVINADGSIVGLQRGNVMHADNWKDVNTYKKVGTYPDRGEDPFVWKDKNGIYHAIIHVGRANTHGLHYYSEDGRKFVPTPGSGYAFTNKVQYTDGTHQSFGCRERPHIVQNKNLDVIALTNGAAPVTCHDASKPRVQDYAYTLLQVVGQK